MSKVSKKVIYMSFQDRRDTFFRSKKTLSKMLQKTSKWWFILWGSQITVGWSSFYSMFSLIQKSVSPIVKWHINHFVWHFRHGWTSEKNYGVTLRLDFLKSLSKYHTQSVFYRENGEKRPNGGSFCQGPKLHLV